MSVPVIQGFALLVLPVMPLIDSSDTCTRATDVVEHSLGDLKPHTQTLEVGGKRSSQIVQPPSR